MNGYHILIDKLFYLFMINIYLYFNILKPSKITTFSIIKPKKWYL